MDQKPEEEIVAKMTRFRLERSKGRLKQLLQRSDEEAFLQMIWAVDLLQGGEPDIARKFIRAPADAAAAKIGDRYFAYKWILEDLVNHRISVRQLPRKEGPNWRLDCTNYDAFTALYNALHQIQDAEQILDVTRRENIWAEMPRIGHRQFSWQQPALNLRNFYRSAVLYGDGALSDHYTKRWGLSPSDMMLFGIGAWAQIGTQPFFSPTKMKVPEVGLSQEIVDAALAVLSASLAEHRRASLDLRGTGRDRIYRPSSLRRHPCISFGLNGERIRCPLRELVLVRCTEGLYYDLVGISDDVRRELGRAFEVYALRFVKAVVDEPVKSSIEYRFKGNTISSPDILVGGPKDLSLVVECKAARMSFDARFGADRQAAGRRGFDELAKGIRQIWRFLSDVRRGLVPDHASRNDVFGLVLTVDPWLRMTVGEYEAIFNQARQWCAENEPDIEQVDQCKVGFTHIEDFERMALQTDATGVIETCRTGSDPNFIGWGFSELRDRAGVKKASREYPFHADMGRALPWWDTIDEVKRTRAKAGA